MFFGLHGSGYASWPSGLSRRCFLLQDCWLVAIGFFFVLPW